MAGAKPAAVTTCMEIRRGDPVEALAYFHGFGFGDAVLHQGRPFLLIELSVPCRLVRGDTDPLDLIKALEVVLYRVQF